MEKIYFETLGCSKNQVDSEKMIFLLEQEGYDIINDPGQADYIIINTCCFIESAKKESISAILELNEYKKKGSCKKLIIAGCLAQHYSADLKDEIPEIDTVFGVGDISLIAEVLKKNESIVIPHYKENITVQRKILNYPGSCYLKISEGCSNNCSYCIIPGIRGVLRSRKIDDILNEIEFLKKQNMKEINIIAQDTANYGLDFFNKRMLGDMVLTIEKFLDASCWIRVLYMHPDHIDSNLLKILGKSGLFVPYFDIPFQSGSRKILKLMNRKGEPEKYLDLIDEIRFLFKDAVIRSTFITGFPGETNRDFSDTLNFIRKANLEWVGGFTYSKEIGTMASRMNGHIKQAEKKRRLDELYMLSHEISTGRLMRFINTTNKFLIEERVEGEDLYIGRFWGQAPEVDGLAVIKGNNLNPGEFTEAKILKLNDRDFYAVQC